jgi:hypothetical protein
MKAEASNQKIAWFQREQQAGTLDLSPDFQRNPVWNDEQASYLVDTVLSELPFPEIYLRSKTDAKGKTRHEVVDGQQRIRSLLLFGSNDLVLEGKEISPKVEGKNFEDLGKKEKERYWNYSVVVRDLGDASNAEIRDLFRRLNKHSVVLNAQELRNARFKGAFITLMEELADDPWWTDVRIVTPKQVRRMEDIEFISELFVGLMAGPQNKKEAIDDYYATYERTFSDKAKYAKQFRDTRALISDVLEHQAVIDWSGKSDFYSLFLSFSHHSEEAWTSPQKRKVGAALKTFRNAVDEAKRKDTEEIRDKTVGKYVQAVTRAASDIDRRKVRINILDSLVDGALR